MKPLKIANAYLEDRQTLDSMWDNDGYLFFTDVLDRHALKDVRQIYLDVLADMGLVRPGASDPIWNGASLDGVSWKIKALWDSDAWKTLVAAPKIDAFFRHVLGDSPYWIPMQEYRITPPSADNGGDRALGRHQDAHYVGGLRYRTCWIPLDHIDERTGGLVVAEGWHKRHVAYDETAKPVLIPADTIPEDDWRWANQSLGDVVIFDGLTPHSGLANYSNRFRISLDTRVVGVSEHRPIVGEVLAVDAGSLTIRDQSGIETCLRTDTETHVRLPQGGKAALTTLAGGMRVIVIHDTGRASVVRHEQYYGWQ